MGWHGPDQVQLIRKNSQAHRHVLLRSQDQGALRPSKLWVGVGGTGLGQGWEGAHPFTPTLKHLLRARPEDVGGETEGSPTTVQDHILQS